MGSLQAEWGAEAGWAFGQGVKSGECLPHSITTVTIVGYQDCARFKQPSFDLGMQHGCESPRHVCQPLSVYCVALAGLAACRRSRLDTVPGHAVVMTVGDRLALLWLEKCFFLASRPPRSGRRGGGGRLWRRYRVRR